MQTVIAPLFVIVFFVFVRAGDLTISAIIARDTLRVIFYGLAALLALICLLLVLIH